MTLEDIRWPSEALSSYHHHLVILSAVRRQPNEVEGLP